LFADAGWAIQVKYFDQQSSFSSTNVAASRHVSFVALHFAVHDAIQVWNFEWQSSFSSTNVTASRHVSFVALHFAEHDGSVSHSMAGNGKEWVTWVDGWQGMPG